MTKKYSRVLSFGLLTTDLFFKEESKDSGETMKRAKIGYQDLLPPVVTPEENKTVTDFILDKRSTDESNVTFDEGRIVKSRQELFDALSYSENR